MSALAREIRELLEDGFDIPTAIRKLKEAADALDGTEKLEDELVKAERALAKMEDDWIFLNCLRNAGVDNWSGYEYAQEEYAEIMGEED